MKRRSTLLGGISWGVVALLCPAISVEAQSLPEELFLPPPQPVQNQQIKGLLPPVSENKQLPPPRPLPPSPGEVTPQEVIPIVPLLDQPLGTLRTGLGNPGPSVISNHPVEASFDKNLRIPLHVSASPLSKKAHSSQKKPEPGSMKSSTKMVDPIPVNYQKTESLQNRTSFNNPGNFPVEVHHAMPKVPSIGSPRGQTIVSQGRQEPAVRLEWLGPKSIQAGQPTEYQIVVKNVSPTVVQQVLVAYRPPDGAQASSNDPKLIFHGPMLTWKIGQLAPFQERRIPLQVTVKTLAPLQFNAAATFTALSSIPVTIHEPKRDWPIVSPSAAVLGRPVTLNPKVSNPNPDHFEK